MAQVTNLRVFYCATKAAAAPGRSWGRRARVGSDLLRVPISRFLCVMNAQPKQTKTQLVHVFNA